MAVKSGSAPGYRSGCDFGKVLATGASEKQARCIIYFGLEMDLGYIAR